MAKAQSLPAGESQAALSGRERMSYGFRALKIPNYRLYWGGQFVSLIGTWMQTTAQAWLVLKLTGSPLALGTVTALQFLPVMLFSLLGGVIADRVPRFRLVLSSQVIFLVLASIFGLLVSSGAIQIWHIYLIALGQGLVTAINQPTQQAFAVELVGRDDRSSAVVMNTMLIHTSRIVGPALAGLMFEPLGVAAILYINALSFVAVIGALLLMDRKAFYAAPKRQQGQMLQELREGLRYTWETPDVLLIMIVMAAVGTFGYNFTITLPLIAEFILKANAAQYGLLSAFMGVGSLAAAFTAAYMGQFTSGKLLIAAGVFSVLLAAVAMTPVYMVSAALLALLGFAGVTFTTSSNTLLQLTVPDALRGRVTSLYFLLFLGSTPIGGFFIGSVSEALGVAETLLLCAILCLVGVIGGAWYYYRRVQKLGDRG